MGELAWPIFLGLLGGISLGINRTLLGRLGVDMGPARASVVNHIGGALFIFVILLFSGGRWDLQLFAEAPAHAYAGGIIGALFVALVSWIIPRAGVMKATVLLISGQMVLGTLLDYAMGRKTSIPVALLGLGLIFAGVLLGEYRKVHSPKV